MPSGKDWLPHKLPGCILLAYLMLGLATLAVMPPFEGVDESMHYSSIKQIADSLTLPVYYESFVAEDVLAYRAAGPMPFTPDAQTKKDGSVFYRDFFADAAKVSAYGELFRGSQPYQPFAPSQEDNWQSQHPPLYYMLMAPVMRAFGWLPLVPRLFLLRLLSFLMALAGVAVATRATLTELPAEKRRFVFAALFAYPVVAPQFFYEFCRLGNDSLCLLLMGLLWALILKGLHVEDNLLIALKQGVVFALGFLTKAFFPPLLAAYAAFLLLRALRERQDKALVRRRLHNLTLIVVPALAASGWYFYKWWVYGTPSGGIEYIAARDNGISIFHPRVPISWEMIYVGIMTMWSSWSWGGTASLGILPRLFHLPVLGASFVLGLGYFWSLRRVPIANWRWLPLFIGLVIYSGLAHHALLLIAMLGEPRTPAWYVHILMPMLMVAYAAALEKMNRAVRAVLVALLIYGVIYMVASNWAEIAMFTGCATIGDDRIIRFPNHSFCIDQAGQIAKNMAVTGYPLLAVIGFGTGFTLLAFGGMIAFSGVMRRDSPSSAR